MNHLIAFYGSIAQNTDVELPVVPDAVITQPSPTRVRVPSDLTTLHFAAASGVTLQKAEIVTPSVEVRRMSLRINPICRGSITFNIQNAQYMTPVAEVSFVATEDLSVVVRQGSAGAETECVLLSLKSPGALPPVPAGDVRILRATGSKTLTPGQWTLVTPVFDKALEPGEYALVGLIAIGEGMIAARVSFPGQVYRPGVIAFHSVAEEGGLVYDTDFLDIIRGYEFGRFTHIAIPQFECLSSIATTSEIFYLLVVKTA